MAYRNLTIDELNDLRKEFIDFLVVNGIDASSWNKIKEQNPQKSISIISSFSQVVFEKVYRQAKYVYKSSERAIFCFLCDKNSITLLSLITDEKPGFDISNAEMLKRNVSFIKSSFQLINQTKDYLKKREFEIDDLVQSGGELGDGTMYNFIQEHFFSDDR